VTGVEHETRVGRVALQQLVSSKKGDGLAA
jgi:hypothetical protein